MTEGVQKIMQKVVLKQGVHSNSLYENLIREYILCIKSHQQQNDMQVKDIERAQKIFYVALISIPIFVGLAVFSGIVFG